VVGLKDAIVHLVGVLDDTVVLKVRDRATGFGIMSRPEGPTISARTFTVRIVDGAKD